MIARSDVAAICEQFTSTNGIVVTEGAQSQIAILINCLQSDRHETWKPVPQGKELQTYFNEWDKLLPIILSEIAEGHRLQARITTMDIVYWTGRNLESVWQRLCPFPGPGELPEFIKVFFPWTLTKPTVFAQSTSFTKPGIFGFVKDKLENA